MLRRCAHSLVLLMLCCFLGMTAGVSFAMPEVDGLHDSPCTVTQALRGECALFDDAGEAAFAAVAEAAVDPGFAVIGSADRPQRTTPFVFAGWQSPSIVSDASSRLLRPPIG